MYYDDASTPKIIGVKVIHITNIPRPYRIPLFVRISELLQARQIEYKVLFYSNLETHSHRQEKLDLTALTCDHEFIKLREIKIGNAKLLTLPFGLGRILRRENADVYIVPGFSILTLFALITIRKAQKRAVLWSGAIHERGLAWLRRPLRRLIVKFPNSFVVYSSMARQYLQNLGASQSISVGLNTIDLDQFIDKSQQWTHRKPNPEVHVIYTGRLIPGKGLRESLKILNLVQAAWRFHIAGDGPDRKRLESLANELNLSERVAFHGFLQQDELIKLLCDCDVYLFPSLIDVWGLVVNEAMACGLPIISSIFSGVTDDLVIDNVNGIRINPSEIEITAQKIEKLFAQRHKLKTMGKESFRIIQQKGTISKSAEGFVEAIDQALL